MWLFKLKKQKVFSKIDKSKYFEKNFKVANIKNLTSFDTFDGLFYLVCVSLPCVFGGYDNAKYILHCFKFILYLLYAVFMFMFCMLLHFNH